MKRTEIKVTSIDATTQKIGKCSNCGTGDIVAHFGLPELGETEVKNLSIGIVIGNTTNEVFIPRLTDSGKLPGVYLRNGLPIVKWENGKITQANPGTIIHLNPSKANEKRDALYQEAYNDIRFIRELPKLDYYELDKVYINGKFGLHEINKISYHNVNRLRQDGSQFPIYSCSSILKPSIGYLVKEADLLFIERGALWKWHHDRDNLKFITLKEEINFHKSMGLTELIPGDWTIDSYIGNSVEAAYESGKIDWHEYYMDFGRTKIRCYKFIDLELKRKVDKVKNESLNFFALAL